MIKDHEPDCTSATDSSGWSRASGGWRSCRKWRLQGWRAVCPSRGPTRSIGQREPGSIPGCYTPRPLHQAFAASDQEAAASMCGFTAGLARGADLYVQPAGLTGTPMLVSGW